MDPSTIKSRNGWAVSIHPVQHLGLQITGTSRTFYNRGGVHSNVSGPSWHHSLHGTHEEIEGAQIWNCQCAALCVLHGIWREFWCTWTCQTSKTLYPHYAWKRMLPPLLWACQKASLKSVPLTPMTRLLNQITDAFTEALTQKWLCMSQEADVHTITCYAFHEDHSDGVLDCMHVLIVIMYATS